MMVSAEPAAALRLVELHCDARLGCSAAERAEPQPVVFTVEIRFDRVPGGCRSDVLSEAVDYALLADGLREMAAEKEFRLIEHMAWRALQVLRPLAGDGARIGVTVNKPLAPVEGLHGGAEFSLKDWIVS